MTNTLIKVKHQAPNANLLVIGPAWADGEPPPQVLKVRDVIADQVNFIEGATFVDALGWFVGRPELIGPDGVHPTDAGHQHLADMIAPLITQELTSPN